MLFLLVPDACTRSPVGHPTVALHCCRHWLRTAGMGTSVSLATSGLPFSFRLQPSPSGRPGPRSASLCLPLSVSPCRSPPSCKWGSSGLLSSCLPQGSLAPAGSWGQARWEALSHGGRGSGPRHRHSLALRNPCPFLGPSLHPCEVGHSPSLAGLAEGLGGSRVGEAALWSLGRLCGAGGCDSSGAAE